MLGLDVSIYIQASISIWQTLNGVENVLEMKHWATMCDLRSQEAQETQVSTVPVSSGLAARRYCHCNLIEIADYWTITYIMRCVHSTLASPPVIQLSYFNLVQLIPLLRDCYVPKAGLSTLLVSVSHPPIALCTPQFVTAGWKS